MASESDYVFFWDHLISAENPYHLAVFSQWYPLSFIDPDQADIEFATAEHYMMYQKALLFDPARADDVLHAETPAEAQRVGRELRGFDRKKWDVVNDGIVERANYLKFGQNRDGRALRTVLDTRGKEMVEASPKDRIWGIGYGKDDAWANKDDWGTNRMGKALQRARETLINEHKHKHKHEHEHEHEHEHKHEHEHEKESEG